MRKLKVVIITLVVFFLLIVQSNIVFAVQPKKQGFKALEQDKTERLLLKNQLKNRERVRTKSFVVSGRLLQISDSQLILKVDKASKNASSLVGQQVNFSFNEKTKVVGLKTLRRINYQIPDNTRAVLSGVFIYDENGNQTATNVRRVVIKFPKIVVLNGQIVSKHDMGLTINVKSSTNSAKDLKGTEVEVILFEKTKITFPSSLTADLKPGLYANVIGFIKDGKILSLRIVVKGKPKKVETTETVLPETTVTTGVATEATQTTDTDSGLSASSTNGATQEATKNMEGLRNDSEGLIKGFVRFIAQIFESLLSFLNG